MISKTSSSSKRLLTSHRGVPSKAPENTLTGLRLAGELGAQWVEIDTQLTKDLVPVVMHDNSVDRTTNGKGLVRELTAAEIAELDAGSWYGEAFAGESVPTLTAALEECKRMGGTLNLELKVYPQDSADALVKQVLKALDETQYPQDKLLFSSFSAEALGVLRQALPNVRRGLCTEEADLDIKPLMKQASLYSVHINFRNATKQFVHKLRNAGAAVAVWTLNDSTQADYFFGLGVENIITDTINNF